MGDHNIRIAFLIVGRNPSTSCSIVPAMKDDFPNNKKNSPLRIWIFKFLKQENTVFITVDNPFHNQQNTPSFNPYKRSFIYADLYFEIIGRRGTLVYF